MRSRSRSAGSATGTAVAPEAVDEPGRTSAPEQSPSRLFRGPRTARSWFFRAAAHGEPSAGSDWPIDRRWAVQRTGRWAAVAFVVIIVGWSLLWAGSNPPGAAPDEPSHYAKAAAAGTGELAGNPIPLADLERLHAFNPAALAQVRHAYRSFTVPRQLRVQTNPPCVAFRRQISAACLARPRPTPPGPVYSIVGAYPPWFYLSGGLLTRLAWSVRTGYLFARVGSALAAGLLLAGGVWLLLDRSRRPAVLVAGLAVAVTPTSVFLASEVGASGAEALGAVASAAAFLRLSRPDPPRGAVWWTAGAVLGLTAATRPLAPVWVLFGLVIAVARLGVRPAVRRFRDGGRPAFGAAALAVAGGIASLGWTQVLGVRTAVQWGRLGHGIRQAWEVAPIVGRQTIAVFGWQDTYGPLALVRAWWLVGLAGPLLAFVVTRRRRERGVLLGAAAGAAGLYVVIAAAVFEQNGFGMQGRYILPALVMLPLLGAEVVAERQPVGRPRLVAAGAGVVIVFSGVGQLVAWWANSRRYAVGRGGPVWFLPSAQWSPPGGWPLSVAGASLLAVLTAGIALLVSYTELYSADEDRDLDTGRVVRTRSRAC
ncbi:MAG: DUF2142 domain-containing protein [Frankia sp.]